ncbi:hypothetical protein RvY_10577 [Ramazzottius varieornatus]|uniref:Uncharacterized protein n=1 Tax=Ramazzottius varieornatus TaxID=947166 RepID=A0A1D1VD79_RAMVA|nr:hypothetical protein RvY_10577 [Ramazzottius varieornatus]
MHSIAVFPILLVSVLSERISVLPDVSWQRSPSASSDRESSGVIRENNIRPSSISRDNSFNSGSRSSSSSSFGFDEDRTSGGSRLGGPGSSGSRNSLSDSDRFPITGNLRPGSSISSSGSADSRFGSSGSSGSRPVSAFGSSSFNTPDPTRGQYVRIVASLVAFENARGTTSTGSSCSTFGHCDPLVFANLDTERPNAAWPGSLDTKFWPQVFAAKSQDSFKMNLENITKDVCGQNYREANLRVHIEDKKALLSNAVINDFDCVINRDPQESAAAATWSPTRECIPRFASPKHTLTYRYKVHYVPRISCGLSRSTTTTTPRSLFG